MQTLKNEKNINIITYEESKQEVKMLKYIYAYDPVIKKRVVYVVKKGFAISLVTGNRFRYKA